MLRPLLAIAALVTAAQPGCRSEPTASQPPTAETTAPPRPEGGEPEVPPLVFPPPAPLRARALGAPPWTALAVAPSRTALAVGTPRGLALLALPGRTPSWQRALPFAPRFLAFSPDGAYVAALGHDSDAGDHIVVAKAAGGELDADVIIGALPSPPQRGPGGGGIEPPTWPTALAPAQDGAPGEFWIDNPYGVYALRRGAASLSAVPGARHWDAAAQESADLWAWADGELAAIVPPDRPAPPPLRPPCAALRGVTDLTLDRAVYACSGRVDRSPRLVLARASSGEVLREVPYDGEITALGLLDADRVEVLAGGPARRGTWTPEGLAWQASPGARGPISLSPSGARAASAGAAGELAVIEVADGRVLCDHGAIRAIAVGFDGEDAVWTLGYEPGVRNRLRVERLALPSCERSGGRPLALGKTTNLLPRWLPAARAFVLDGLYGRGAYGPVLVAVDGEPPVRPFAGGTPAFEVGPDGALVALLASERGSVYRAGAGGAPPTEIAPDLDADHVALCGARFLTYTYRGGWVVHDATTGAPVPGRAPFLATLQPDTFACRADRLLIGRVNQLHVVDVARGAIERTFDLGDERAFDLAILPDGARALAGGGPTGWRVIELE